MSFDWSDFLKIAEALYNNPLDPGPEEAAYRTAASRAYYAAHKSAVVFGRSESYQSSRNRTEHFGIIEYFKTHPGSSRTRREIYLRLDRMRRNRNSADYRDTVRGAPVRLARQNVQMSREVLSLLSRL